MKEKLERLKNFLKLKSSKLTNTKSHALESCW